MESKRKKLNSTKILAYFASLMALLYLAMGFFLIFNTRLKEQFPAKFLVSIGAVLIAYGVFRIYRGIQYWKEGE